MGERGVGGGPPAHGGFAVSTRLAAALVDAREPSGLQLGERRIRAAMIERAMIDVGVIHDSSQRRPVDTASARSWIESRDREWPYSFEACCEALGLSARGLRAKAAALRGVHPPRLLAEGRRMKVSVPSSRQKGQAA